MKVIDNYLQELTGPNEDSKLEQFFNNNNLDPKKIHEEGKEIFDQIESKVIRNDEIEIDINQLKKKMKIISKSQKGLEKFALKSYKKNIENLNIKDDEISILVNILAIKYYFEGLTENYKLAPNKVKMNFVIGCFLALNFDKIKQLKDFKSIGLLYNWIEPIEKIISSLSMKQAKKHLDQHIRSKASGFFNRHPNITNKWLYLTAGFLGFLTGELLYSTTS